jgi:hypothetical protein
MPESSAAATAIMSTPFGVVADGPRSLRSSGRTPQTGSRDMAQLSSSSASAGRSSTIVAARKKRTGKQAQARPSRLVRR